MNTYVYKPKGVCSQQMSFTIENEVIKNCEIIGGCQGNLSGIAKILVNKNIDEIIDIFSNITCGMRKTSCPDQIAQALKEYKGSVGQ